MSGQRPDDQARVSILVRVPVDVAFRVFTEQIDQWWRRGPRFRVAGRNQGILFLEPRAGGRLYESFEAQGETRVFETGKVTVWEPPSRLVLTWRTSNFGPEELTEVEVRFAESASGEATEVTVTHRGWSALREDHPV
ncbi:MAG: SRPBCC domain-containing protein, partial [Polyangiaceae bacterium]